MTRRVTRVGESVIVYDDDILDQADDQLFVPPGKDAKMALTAAGRGQVFHVVLDGRACVLRHYYRGGAVSHFAGDSFIWLGPGRARPCREWDLLYALTRKSLAVPRPVAARYVRHGLRYTADIITELLPAVSSLADRMNRDTVPEALWARIGETIAHFHREGVFHADLNAHNIQIDDDGRVFLLDFDRGRLMHVRSRWRASNLARLKRSLQKISAENKRVFGEHEWNALQSAYQASFAR